jgi:hypothetical protein
MSKERFEVIKTGYLTNNAIEAFHESDKYDGKVFDRLKHEVIFRNERKPYL